MTFESFRGLVLRMSNIPSNMSSRMAEAFKRCTKGGGQGRGHAKENTRESMNFRVFVAHVAVFLHGSVEERLGLLEKIFDRRMTGRFVVAEDVTKVLEDDELVKRDRQIDFVVMDCFQEMDVDHDGKITLKELREWLRKERTLSVLIAWAFEAEKRRQRVDTEEEATEGREGLISSAVKKREEMRRAQQNDAAVILGQMERDSLQKEFSSLKVAFGGRVDKIALAALFQNRMPDPMLSRLFALFDDNLDGRLSEREFMVGISLLFSSDRTCQALCMFCPPPTWLFSLSGAPSGELEAGHRLCSEAVR